MVLDTGLNSDIFPGLQESVLNFPHYMIQWSTLNLSSQPCVSVGGVVAKRSIVGLVLHYICMRQLQMPLD